MIASHDREGLWNKLKVVKIDLTDRYEGLVTLETSGKKRFSAMFWGAKFDLNEYYLIKFRSLDFPLEWEVRFSGNKARIKMIQDAGDDCSFIAYGQILSIYPVVVDFGDLVMELGEWTNDDRVIDEFIYWKIDRLDILDVKNCDYS